MRRLLPIASILMFAAGPVLADPPAPAEPAPTVMKMKKVCHPGTSSNPLYPEMKCHMVPVSDSTSTAASATTQVALQNPGTPH